MLDALTSFTFTFANNIYWTVPLLRHYMDILPDWKNFSIDSRTGVLKLFLRRAGVRLQCNLKGPELFLEGAEYVRKAHITSAKSLADGFQGPLKGPWKLWGYTVVCRCSLMQSQPYFGPFTICLKHFVIYKLITIIVIILDPCVLKRTCTSSQSSYTWSS